MITLFPLARGEPKRKYGIELYVNLLPLMPPKEISYSIYQLTPNLLHGSLSLSEDCIDFANRASLVYNAFSGYSLGYRILS